MKVIIRQRDILVCVNFLHCTEVVGPSNKDTFQINGLQDNSKMESIFSTDDLGNVLAMS